LGIFADQLEVLAGDGPWIAVGHSMGAKMALDLAARRPEGLVGLVLISPSPPTPEPMCDADRDKSLKTFGDASAARSHLAEITEGRLEASVFEACVEDQLLADRAAWIWWLTQGSREDISGATEGLSLSTLVIAGDSDRVMDLHTPLKVAAGLKRARVSVIPGGGHLVPLEKPAVVAEHLLAFIDAVMDRSE
jgi:pimeloyl-ACP methyl ester carboxylesterase